MDSNNISRRQALKALLVAGGSLTAVSFMPSKWIKPLVVSGFLPVHAQASGNSFSNPAEAGDSSNNRNGHQLAPISPYIYYNFDSTDFSQSSIAATVGGANVTGIDVELDITNVVGTAQFGYLVSGVPTFSFPISRTTDGTGVAHFPFLMPNHFTTGSSCDLTFTYRRGAAILYVSNVPFTIEFDV